MDCLNFMLYFLLGEMLQISCCSHSKYYVLPMNFTAEEFQSGKIYCKLGEPLYSDSPETGNMYNYAVTDTDLIRVINDLQREAHSDLLWTGYRNISNTDHTLYAGILQVDSDQRPVIAFIPTDAAANKSFPALCQREMLLIIYAISSGSGLIIVILVVTIIILKWKSNPSVTKEGPLVVSNATYQDEEATTSNTRGEETQTNGPPMNKANVYELIRVTEVVNLGTHAPNNEYDQITSGILSNTTQSSDQWSNSQHESNVAEQNRECNETKMNVENSDGQMCTATPLVSCQDSMNTADKHEYYILEKHAEETTDDR
ncbi:uncharacterized protein LOC128234736 isoform X2 [Mya arenaria]|uniref:uncharacterized protein LOC128234736 isoform X2 n=1 Tax=Mya arenaria TaxID=6604 RepID=UPI0022DFFD72|nr:uncharacterized protein LOC128234736 isoform X2 [Mya arenaria]